MTQFTPDLIAKAKAAKNAAEVFELAKAHGIELTEEEAKTYFDQLHKNCELSDEDLDSVAGGAECGEDQLTVNGLPEGTFVAGSISAKAYQQPRENQNFSPAAQSTLLTLRSGHASESAGHLTAYALSVIWETTASSPSRP